MKNKLPIIIDCDPGVDDSIALILIYKHIDKFDIKLLSSCAGNLPIDITTNNLKFFAKNFFNGTPVAQGYGKPITLKFESNVSDIHGEGGLGDFKITEQDYPILPQLSHHEMYKILKESSEPITIISIGPMTNLGLLLKEYPNIKNKITAIYCMIGSVNGMGNIKPYAEFNAYYDPHAFKIVADSGIKLVINPIEIGEKTYLKKFLVEKAISKNQIHTMIKQLVSGLMEPDDNTIVRLYDANTSLALINPDLYEFTPCDVKVSIDKETLGKCVCEKNIKGKSLYQTAKQRQAVKEYLLSELLDF